MGNKLTGKKLAGKKRSVVKRLGTLVGGAAAVAGAVIGGYWLRTKSRADSTESTTDDSQP